MHNVPSLRTTIPFLSLQIKLTFFSILNHDFQFVLAEATKTTNIGNSEICAEGDGLFVGTSKLPSSWNICHVCPIYRLFLSGVVRNLTLDLVFSFD